MAAFARAAFWRGAAGGEHSLRRDFWRKLRDVAARLPFVGELLAAYYCAFDRETPPRVKATLIAAIAYFVLPLDTMPDVMPALGFTDDAAVLAAAIKMVSSHIKPAHREAARAKVEELRRA